MSLPIIIRQSAILISRRHFLLKTLVKIYRCGRRFKKNGRFTCRNPQWKLGAQLEESLKLADKESHFNFPNVRPSHFCISFSVSYFTLFDFRFSSDPPLPFFALVSKLFYSNYCNKPRKFSNYIPRCISAAQQQDDIFLSLSSTVLLQCLVTLTSKGIIYYLRLWPFLPSILRLPNLPLS